MKKIFSVMKSIFTWLLVIAAVAMMIFTIVSVNTFDHSDRSLFGYKAFIVLSDSMSSVKGDASQGYFNAGDLILVKETDASTLKAGDIISYTSTNSENFGETVTHMIRRLTEDAEGNPGFITYGTSTDTDDANMVDYRHVLGKYETKVPLVGQFFSFLRTTPGYIVCIFLPFLLLIVMQGISSIRLFKKYKAEQLEEIEAKRKQELEALEAERQKEREALEAERAAMAEERKKQEEMMQQLLAMQQAMQANAQAARVTTPAQTEKAAPVEAATEEASAETAENGTEE